MQAYGQTTAQNENKSYYNGHRIQNDQRSGTKMIIFGPNPTSSLSQIHGYS